MKTTPLILLATLLMLAPSVAFGTTTPQFVPLTSIPVFGSFSGADNLASFLNAVYRLSIGVAASLAVIQIVRAGIYFMTNTGSFSHNEKAKSLIRDAIFGLVLVLSPAIVFGIIDPRILSLNITTTGLQTGSLGSRTPAPTGCPANMNSLSHAIVEVGKEACCTAAGLTNIRPYSGRGGQDAGRNRIECSAQPFAEAGQHGQRGPGDFYYNIPVRPGHYRILAYNVTESASCTQIRFQDYPAEAECRTALQGATLPDPPWLVWSRCSRNDTNERNTWLGVSGGRAFCPAIEPI